MRFAATRSTARSVVLGACVLLAGASAAPAADLPLSAVKLVAKQTAGGQKIVFVSRDASLPSPAAAEIGDPSVLGLAVEVIAQSGAATPVFAVPPGVGTPGWTVKPSAWLYRNPDAPGGPTPVRRLVLKPGKRLKILVHTDDPEAAPPYGTAGVRITIDADRVCAYFDASRVRRDTAERFVARDAPAGGIADCTTASLSGVAPACGDGELNQASEECDGGSFDLVSCPDADEPMIECQDDCRCCTTSDGCDIYPCCDPTDSCQPSISLIRHCVPCSPEGGSCGGDLNGLQGQSCCDDRYCVGEIVPGGYVGSCKDCAAEGETCAILLSVPYIIPCCDGRTCVVEGETGTCQTGG